VSSDAQQYSSERTHCALSSSPMATVTGSVNDLFAQHLVLLSRVKEAQKAHRRKLRALPSPPLSILNLPTLPTPKPSPPPSPPSSPLLVPRRKPPRADLPPPKRARAAHYENYVPEEETIRNDYSQRYVDGGEWPQNWVLGAEPERRFEEYVVLCSCLLRHLSSLRPLVYCCAPPNKLSLTLDTRSPPMQRAHLLTTFAPFCPL
jgi:hypothetical protein